MTTKRMRAEATPASAAVWLAARLYLAYVWGSYGVQKVLDGWLTGDVMGDLLSAVADPEITSAPLSFYTGFAQWMVDAGITPALSIAIPLTEIAIAVAFLCGLALLPVALMAVTMNVNFILSGVAPILFDMRIIALQLLLVAAWRVAGAWGVGGRFGPSREAASDRVENMASLPLTRV